MKEIEAKLKLEDESAMKKMSLNEERHVFVFDIYFDHPVLKIKSQDEVLRLRKENENYFIAFKGPREEHDDLLVRDELETKIDSFDNGLQIIKGLGFQEIAKVEKYRTYFSIKLFPSLSITLDKYPFIGSFIEIEGDEDEVHSFLKKFNFDLKDTVQKSCSESFLEYLKKNNIKLDSPKMHFTFEDEEVMTKNIRRKLK